MQKLLSIEQFLNWKFNEIITYNIKEIGACFLYSCKVLDE
jgi:hypothetical protein